MPPARLQHPVLTMPLRKRQKQAVEESGGKVEGERKTKSKRQRIFDFLRSGRKQKSDGHDASTVPVRSSAPSHPHHPTLTVHKLMASFHSKIPVAVDKPAPQKPARDSKIAESTRPAKSSSSVEVARPGADASKEEQKEPIPLPTPPAELKDEHKAEPLSEDHIHALFSGAPHYYIKKREGRTEPSAAYPWDNELTIRDLSDSIQLAQPAFSAATLHRHLPILQQSSDQVKKYQGYNLDVVEVPSMLSAQGIEPGSIGLTHFLQMPESDNLVTDLQQSQSSNGFLEAVRNKEQMQNSPEKLGIRTVDMNMVYDRLIEFGDLFEAFHESPERMTILNNQTAGDLYANLFGKFLTPPRYDGSADDPTGIKVQIDTLLKVLGVKGIWYDFGLVEWRIRLGQILWSDPDPVLEHESHPLWTDREILLLQITLACELLLRLDAVSSMDADDVKGQMHVSPQDFEGFLDLKTKKIDWDLVLARRFLENILVVKESDVDPSSQTPKSRGLLGMLSSSDSQEQSKGDIVLLPQHQARQLSGLLYFAETVEWPGIELIMKDLAQKLGVLDNTQEPEEQSSGYGKFLDPSTPSSISVYGTPLATPRSTSGMLDNYFGHIGKPPLSRNNSRPLQVPLSTTLIAHADGPAHALNVGGWLSRSYLTGLILPGEAISHFLMSTLLENDKLAIATLGDSANLYGGFIYAERTWWSKSSVVGRVLACIEGSVECMGWIAFTKLPEGLSDGWYAITSEQVSPEQPPRIAADIDLVDRESAIIPGGVNDNVKPEDLTLPLDSNTPPIPSVEFTQWKLTLIDTTLTENDSPAVTPSSEAASYVASITFTSFARGIAHAIMLTHDIQFITSYPCTPPTASPTPSLPKILKRASTSQPLSRSSSQRSVHTIRSATNRPSRHPSRRNSHGFEPLLSHPPDSAEIAPQRMYSPVPDEEPSASSTPKPEPMNAHPLHASYKYKIVPATEVLDPNFLLPFTMHSYVSPQPSVQNTPKEEVGEAEVKDDTKNVLVLDARASRDLELLARAWCAEKGLHAIIGRVGRSCLACCIREARGLGVNVVIRV